MNKCIVVTFSLLVLWTKVRTLLLYPIPTQMNLHNLTILLTTTITTTTIIIITIIVNSIVIFFTVIIESITLFICHFSTGCFHELHPMYYHSAQAKTYTLCKHLIVKDLVRVLDDLHDELRVMGVQFAMLRKQCPVASVQSSSSNQNKPLPCMWVAQHRITNPLKDIKTDKGSPFIEWNTAKQNKIFKTHVKYEVNKIKF